MADGEDIVEEDLPEEVQELDLTVRQKIGLPKFFKGIAKGKKMGDIADDIGVTRKTLWEWRQKEEFMDGVKALYQQGIVELLPLVVQTFQQHLEGDRSSRDVDIAKTVIEAAGVGQQEEEAAPQPIKIERTSSDEADE